jgi:putative heme transporter
VRAVAIAVALGLTATFLVGNRRMVIDGVAALIQARPELVAAAVVAQVLSLITYALMVRRLLGLANLRLSLRSVLGITLTGDAITNSIPGGQASSAVYWYRRLHHAGAAGPLAALILSLATVTGVLTLLVLAAVGLAVDPGGGLLAPLRWPLIIGAGVLIGACTFQRRRLAKALRRAAKSAGASDQVALARATHPRNITALLTLGVANWLTDVISLIVALLALGVSVPWPAVLLAYTCAQIVSSIPLLPGGGGTVEVTLAVGIGAAGHASAGLVAGVILYRLISAWGQVPIGWLIWMRSSAAHAVDDGRLGARDEGPPPRRRLRTTLVARGRGALHPPEGLRVGATQR